MKNRIIYQLFLRPFTPEGTLAAAKEKLEHIASLGIDTIYLTSCCKADSDDNEAHFSPRQKASKTGNPKNPYRISDYYALDEEYGTIDDLSDFVNTAHALGLEVLFDVVFLHCGPSAVFLEDHPDFVKRDADGNIVCNAWCFPEINFDSPSLRRYLIDNMKYWVTECDFDGFRCDVGDQIPLDFWADATAELKNVKPSLYMLNEGVIPEYLSVFDSNYSFKWTHAMQAVIRGQKNASFLKETDEEGRRDYGSYPYVILRALETHDYANDHYDNRPDKALPAKMVDCAHIINFMMDGIPFIYNGNEIADGKRHSIWSNQEYGGMRIDWSNAYSEVGKARIELMKRVIALRRSNDWLFDGKTLWIDSNRSDRIAAFVRKSGDNAFLVLANFSDNSVFVELSMPFDIKKMSSLISRDIFCDTGSRQLKITANSYGFAIISLK